MLKNYLKTAWRSLMNNKVFSFINIFGLSAGLTCCMLIALYLHNELNYDNYHNRVSDLYEVGTVFIFQHKEAIWGDTPAPMAQGLQKEFPEIEESTRLMGMSMFEDKTLLQYNAPGGQRSSFYETKGFLADSNFFRMFTYDFVEGDASTALVNPATIVLSEEIARKIFGNQPALNKIIHTSSNSNGEYNYTVTGVFRPGKAPSHIDARFFMSINGGDMGRFVQRQASDFTTNNMFYTYLKLRPGTNPAALEAKFPSFLHKYAAEGLKAVGFDKRQFLIPVKDIHLRSDVTSNVTPAGSKTYLYILGSIAVFTLLIACINFMNLSTARSSKRSAEVGVRKVLGAERKGLIMQFLGESLLLALIAFSFACLFTQLLLPAFNMMTDKELTFSISQHFPLFLGFVGLAVFTGVVAGSYPAFYLSSFKPIRVLKGKFKNSFAAVSLRKGLVVFQFMISVALIISAIVITRQMNFLRTKDLGFEKTGQIIVPLRSATSKKIFRDLKNSLTGNSLVMAVGGSVYYPGIKNPGDDLYHLSDRSAGDNQRIRINYVDGGFQKALGLQIVAGRLFSDASQADTNNRIIINENAVQTLGIASAQNAIGKKIVHANRGQNPADEIIGVVKDFHFEDLHLPLTPFAFKYTADPSNYNYMVVHTRPGEMVRLLPAIRTSWNSLDPGEPFEYSFLDEDFLRNYKADERMSAMIRFFTIMAILISCLGLFGLASFSAEQRFKEIGIRKVLGASTGSIVIMLSKDFLKLVCLSVLIASPLAWYMMNRWLDDFAYRTPIGWTVFAYTLFIALFIAVFTISFQAIRAALTNPVESLKSE